MKIILIGNYKLDRQESMERFTHMLNIGFNNSDIKTEVWRPIIFFGRKSLNPYAGVGKYLGYLDKWVLFPLIIRFRLLKKSNSNKNVKFHICDHSNAPYLKHFPKHRSGITCHDVLAIRGALGYKDAYCPASGMGVILQKWIFSNLIKTKNLISVSHFTRTQLKELCVGKKIDSGNWSVVHNGFNAPFKPLSKEKCSIILRKYKLNNESFILHVGSSLSRKNRKLLLDMTISLIGKWKGYICYAGDALDKELLDYIKENDLQDRVISIVSPEHDTLVALYSACTAFVFPSLSEGFGWPLIEAQACGSPVIASNFQPMPEVSGGTALHVSPLDPDSFAKSFLDLQNDVMRARIIEKGFENVKRFSNDKMIKEYIKIYTQI